MGIFDFLKGGRGSTAASSGAIEFDANGKVTGIDMPAGRRVRRFRGRADLSTASSVAARSRMQLAEVFMHSRLLQIAFTAFMVSAAGSAKSLTDAPPASQDTYPDVEVRFADTVKREMQTASGTLVLDAGARRLRVQSGKRPLDVAYDDVRQVIVEVDTFGRKAGFGASFLGMFTGGLLFGNAIATSIDKPFDNDHFVLIEYATPDGSTAQYLMSIPKKEAPRLLKALPVAFGERVVVPAFDEKADSVEKPTPHKKTTFAGLGTGTAKQHPIPESRADKALVVVVTPATIMRRLRPEKRGGGVTIRANDVPVGLSGPGTYTFFYLDPGEYFVASYTGQLVGLRMKLEAGKDYYVAQTIYAKGIRMRSFLRRHSKELVMHEVTGSLWTDSTIEASAGTAGAQ